MKKQPWLATPTAADSLHKATVVGAGIAGATVARQLAERGCEVQVFETDAAASGASGNPAAVLRPVLARSLEDPLARFTTDAFLASKRKILQLCLEGHDIAHAFDGVLHCHPAPDALQGKLRHQVWNTDRARLMLGDAAQQGGAWLPDAGWVSPVDYIRALLQHDNIELAQEELGSLHHDGLGWRLYDPEGRHFQDTPLVVLANGWRLTELTPTSALPLCPVISQLLHFEAGDSLAPSAPVVGPATICPSAVGYLAAAGHWPRGSEPSETVRRAQLRETAKQLWAGLDGSIASSRSPTRAASRDHLPVVGGVPDFALASELYADLRHGRPAHHYPEPPYLDGLYVLGALGGRGITTAQLCAELLVDVITGVTHPWQAATHPLRFLVRELKRKQSDD